MANFNIHFLDSNDDLLLLTQEDNNRDVHNVALDVDMEDLMNPSVDSAVCSLASAHGNKSDSDEEVINVADRYKPITEDIFDDEG